MCGILVALGLQGSPSENRRILARQTRLLRHRGPDSTTIWQSSNGECVYCFERLHIIDPSESGRQPFHIERPEGLITWALNSEIYNHEEIKETGVLKGVRITKDSKSDSALIGHLYQKLGDGPELWNMLDGVFACVLYDEATNEYIAARDPLGICPLYWGKGRDGSTWLSSEMKALQSCCVSFEIFPPGHMFRSRTGQLERHYNPQWLDPERIPSGSVDYGAIRELLIKSVVKRLMSDAPLGVLLSGGLDSSLVAAIAMRHLPEAKNAYDNQHALHTFSVGIEGSPDLLAARKVADFLGTKHHELHFTVQEGLDCLHDLIYHLESFEQVRAAVPMYLLARRIKSLGFKVVMSGEGADEIFGGYLYFHKAPSAAEFHKETVRKTTRLHQWDVLRANKAPFAFGLEPRVPFLDKAFVAASMEVDPSEKMIDMKDRPDGKHARMEKYILRKAFDLADKPYLPEAVLWRQKEQFSDGVGYDWVDGLKAFAAQSVTDEMWAARQDRFPQLTPVTREYYLLREIFEDSYPSPHALATVPYGPSVACSTPEACSWDPEWAKLHEISGRAMKNVHESHEGFKAQSPSDADPPALGGPCAKGSAKALEPPHANGAPAHQQPNGHVTCVQ